VLTQAEAEADLRRWLHSVLWALSGDSPYGTWMEQLSSASGSELLDTIPAPPDATLSWLSEADLDYMTDQFELHGLFGPIAWYRNFGDWYEISDALDHPAAGAAAGAATGAGAKAEEAQPPQRFEMPSGFLYGSDSDIMRFDPNWEEEMPHYFKDMRMCALRRLPTCTQPASRCQPLPAAQPVGSPAASAGCSLARI
jgi:hypothetical protein